MTYSVCGYCSLCGAPMHVPSVWYGIYPPNPQPSCNCARRQVRTYGTFGGSRGGAVDRAWDNYFNPPFGMRNHDEWERYRNKIATYDADSDSYGDPYPARGASTQPPNREEEHRLQHKIKETRKVVENIRHQQQKAAADASKNDLSGIDSLEAALGEAEKEDKVADLEARMDRVEMMVVSMTQALSEVKTLLQEAKEREERFADDGK